MLSAAPTRIMSGQIDAAMPLAQSQACERKEWVSGRTIFQRYESSRDSGVASGVTALVSLTQMGDNGMQEFMLKRNQVLQASSKALEDVDRREIVYSHMRESKGLTRDLEHYTTAVEGAFKRLFSFLWMGMQRYVDRHIKEHNRHDLDSALICRPAAPSTQRAVKKRGRKLFEEGNCKTKEGMQLQQRSLVRRCVPGEFV